MEGASGIAHNDEMTDGSDFRSPVGGLFGHTRLRNNRNNSALVIRVRRLGLGQDRELVHRQFDIRSLLILPEFGELIGIHFKGLTIYENTPVKVFMQVIGGGVACARALKKIL